MDRDTREALGDILGFRTTPAIGKFLGIPIKSLSSSSQDFNFVLDRVKQKLVGWKANLLSLARRAILVQASLVTIPVYAMQCTYLPNKILEGIDLVNRNFLWGTIDQVRRMHWVSWSKITRPKVKGGLGLQTIKGKNITLLAKLNWRFHMKGEALWARVLENKYCSQLRVRSRNQDKLPCSRIWTGMKKGKNVFKLGTRWILGRNSQLRFWFDNWSNQVPLRQVIQGPLPLASEEDKVADVFTNLGCN